MIVCKYNARKRRLRALILPCCDCDCGRLSAFPIVEGGSLLAADDDSADLMAADSNLISAASGGDLVRSAAGDSDNINFWEF